MNRVINFFVISIGLIMGFPLVAMAYVGPGAGVTLIGSLLGLIFAILFVLAGIVLWPLRILWRRYFAKKTVQDPSITSSDSDKSAVNETEEESH